MAEVAYCEERDHGSVMGERIQGAGCNSGHTVHRLERNARSIGEFDEGGSESEKKQSAYMAALAIILLIVTWAGKYLLEMFGIKSPGLEVAGGVIIALIVHAAQQDQ